MRRELGLALGTVALVLAANGCKPDEIEKGARGTVADKLVKREQQGKEELKNLFAARDERVKKTLEELNLASLQWDPETPHPLVKWRSDLNANDEVPEKLKEHAPKYPGTELEKLIPRYQAYFQSNQKFWKDPDTSSVDEYQGFLSGVRGGKAGEVIKTEFGDDALFDEVFVHARRGFDIFKVDPENRVTSVFRFWQLAFEFPNLPNEAFMPYIARLCEKDDTFRTFCRKIPFEFRHLAIMSPYYDVLLARLKEIKDKYPNTPYMPAVDYLTAYFTEEQKKQAKEFEEYPILGDSMAFLPASQRLTLEIGPRGIMLGNRPLEMSEDNTFALTAAKSKSLEEMYVKVLSEIRAGGEPELKQGQIGILAAKETPTGAVLRLAWAPMAIPEEEQSQLNLTSYLVGRRRFDFSNLKVANELQLMPKKDVTPLNVSYPGGAINCDLMGFTGQRAIEMAPAAAYVHVDASGKLVAGSLAVPPPPPAEGAPPPDPAAPPVAAVTPPPTVQTNVMEANWAELSKWVSGMPGPVALVVSPDAPWDAFIRALGPLAFACKDDKCEKSEPRAQPNIYVGFCN